MGEGGGRSEFSHFHWIQLLSFYQFPNGLKCLFSNESKKWPQPEIREIFILLGSDCICGILWPGDSPLTSILIRFLPSMMMMLNFKISLWNEVWQYGIYLICLIMTLSILPIEMRMWGIFKNIKSDAINNPLITVWVLRIWYVWPPTIRVNSFKYNKQWQ